MARDEGLRAHYRELIRLRLADPALRRGDYTMLTQPADRVLAFMRRDAASGDAVSVLANREDEAIAADVALPPAWNAPAARDRLDGAAGAAAAPPRVQGGRLKVDVPAKSVRIVVPSAP